MIKGGQIGRKVSVIKDAVMVIDDLGVEVREEIRAEKTFVFRTKQQALEAYWKVGKLSEEEALRLLPQCDGLINSWWDKEYE